MNKQLISKERKQFLKKQKQKKYWIFLTQILILVGFLGIWEVLANQKIIDSFITSQPSRIWETLINLGSNDLLKHIGVTVYETVIGFLLGTLLGIIIAIILWWSNFLSKVADPYLVVLNSLPKVALRTSNYYLGRGRNTSNYCNGSGNFVNCNHFRKLKWLFKNRQRSYKNGKNLSSNKISNLNKNSITSQSVNLYQLLKSQHWTIASRCDIGRILSIQSRPWLLNRLWWASI